MSKITITETVLVGNFCQTTDELDYQAGQNYRRLMSEALVAAYSEHDVIVDICLQRASGCAPEVSVHVDEEYSVLPEDVLHEMDCINSIIAEKIYDSEAV